MRVSLMMRVSRTECFALVVLLSFFALYTWRGITMFFSGDDVINMYRAWDTNAWKLAEAQLFIWMPLFRPVGRAIYRIFYEVFGFNPLPLYIFCWLLLAANVVLAYFLFRRLTGHVLAAVTGVALILVHGSFRDLYYSAGTIFDRLSYFFIAAGLLTYFRFRRTRSWLLFSLLCVETILAMGSKESGVALPVLLFFCELVYFLPEARKQMGIRQWLRQILPLYGTLAIFALLFVFSRVRHDRELLSTSDFSPSTSPLVWLAHVGEYLAALTYSSAPFSPVTAAILLGTGALLAAILKNRPMIFGLLFFVLAITPVALIKVRFSYVLYVPSLGLGLFLGSLIVTAAAFLTAKTPRLTTPLVVLVLCGVMWIHWKHWARPFDMTESPELAFTKQFRKEYPSLPPKSRLLFVSDKFPAEAWDLMFTTRLLYHDKTIVTDRLQGLPAQRPNPAYPFVYDHIFSGETGRYLELDPLDPHESIRLNILRNYQVTNEMDMTRRDHSAYVVYGLKDGTGPETYRWTAPKAKFKFKLGPSPTVVTAKIFIPEFLKSNERVLILRVNGQEVGRFPFSKDGIQEITFKIPRIVSSGSGYTFLDMDVENPYKDEKGVYGVVLLRAGFDYAQT